MWTTMLLVLAPLAAQEPVEAILAPTRAALAVEPDAAGEIQLSRLLAEFEAASDWTILIDEETRGLLEESAVCTFSTLRAEPEAVTRTVGAALASSLYYWTVVRAEPPRMLRVDSLVMTGGESAPGAAAWVPIERIARYAEHPAVYVQTLMSCESLDSAAIANAGHVVTGAKDGFQVVLASDTGDVLVSGPGPRVASFVDLLRAADRMASGTPVDSGEPEARTPKGLDGAGASITIPADDEGSPTLLDLTRMVAEHTGSSALLYRDSARLLGLAPVGLPHPIVVHGEDLVALFEQLLIDRRFVLERLVEGSGALFSVRSMNLYERRGGANYAFVEPAALASWARRPASPLVTVLRVPHLDAEALANSLRALGIEEVRSRFASGGAAPLLMLRGFGAQVARVGRMVEAADRAAAMQAEERR